MTILSDHHLLPMSPCILHWDSNQCMKQLNVDITKTSAICNNKIKKTSHNWNTGGQFRFCSTDIGTDIADWSRRRQLSFDVSDRSFLIVPANI